MHVYKSVSRYIYFTHWLDQGSRKCLVDWRYKAISEFLYPIIQNGATGTYFNKSPFHLWYLTAFVICVLLQSFFVCPSPNTSIYNVQFPLVYNCSCSWYFITIFQNQNNYHLFIIFHSLAREFNFYICFIMAITLLQTKSKVMGKKDKKSIFMFIIRLEHTVTCWET